MDIPGISAVHGAWDMRGKFKEYMGGLDVCGRTFLDVCTASGFPFIGVNMAANQAIAVEGYLLSPP
jgi:hypothetical protein